MRSAQAMAVLLALGLLAVNPPYATPCTLCGNPQNTTTFREELGLAKLVVFGTVEKSRLGGGGTGTSEFQVDVVLKNDPILGEKRKLDLPRYVPVEGKEKPRYLIFCEVGGGKVDPYRAIPLKSKAAVDYLKGAAELNPADRVRALEYYFRYLDSEDNEVAQDAYLEFAKANDKEIGLVAAKLAPTKFRKLIEAAATPTNRVGLYAFLTGACGGNGEADFLRGLLDKPTERTSGALDGILAGYIQLRPREGWDLTLNMLKDGKRSLTDRLAVVHTLRFFHGWKGDESRRELLAALGTMVPQGDLADMAIEDLRRWGWWDLTDDVLAQYGKKSHDAPIMKQAIVRYALSCPKAEAARFIAERRKQEAELVKDVEASLQSEKPK
jgi:hypothetical protein